MKVCVVIILFFFFNDTATTEIYTLSLHDALPIWILLSGACFMSMSSGNSASDQEVSTSSAWMNGVSYGPPSLRDRKSTRLNSSHSQISYAVFCLKKKN